ncbi:ubiquinone biosynthesis O-methyltransferase [Laetiporus sulphureus 93-53]|uniref:Ubiquinone biosynthesis O-methyltransferase, mitochondrial n=1 Tax=Laetiporus sulphureus 93-53 TaxID=1314785 RepID=A0A165EKR3_9APHY|nr:ubiquinone biosynthesis O-methyltransferase [Laetiporus sulphureus 93-53]KZT07263.1 ubiquinone biosynthesis O-methyltransferase [Laetiporus sulphureus 93-53]
MLNWHWQQSTLSRAGRSVVRNRRASAFFGRSSHSLSSTQSTVNPNEIDLFSRLSSQWWDERGEFTMLHKMNPIRMRFIREKLIEMKREDVEDSAADESQIFQGLDVLDVGCGGGLLCESLTRLGANALGIDASASNIGIAALHASADPALHLSSSPVNPSFSTSESQIPHRHGRLAYEHTSVEELLALRGPKQFDVVCSMEVLEHVDNPRAFLRSCAELVKPGGHLFLSTIARTPLAYFLTIFAAEDLFRKVTPGTHTYSKFILPSELISYFHDYRSSTPSAGDSDTEGRRWISRLYNGVPARTEAETRGMIYLPWKGEWMLVSRSSFGPQLEGCNYMFWVRRPRE